MENQVCAFCGKEFATTVLAYRFTAEYGWNTGTKMGKLDRSTNLNIPLCIACSTQRRKREKRNFVVWGICIVFGIALFILTTSLSNDLNVWWGCIIPTIFVFGPPVFLFQPRSEKTKILNWLEINDNKTWRHITFKDIRGN